MNIGILYKAWFLLILFITIIGLFAIFIETLTKNHDILVFGSMAFGFFAFGLYCYAFYYLKKEWKEK